MIKLRTRLALLLAAPALVLGALAIPVGPAVAAAGFLMTDGGGSDLSIRLGLHGDIAVMVGANVASTFTEVPVGTHFELKSNGGLCLTVNAADGNRIYSESCSGADSTLWFVQVENGGDLLNSVLVTLDQGVTGHLTADPHSSCGSGLANLLAQGGLPAGDCHQKWSGA